MKILVTRPEPGASATAARLTAMGFEPVLAPSLAITPLAARLPPHPAALIITSAQAIPALPATLRGTPVFCVGDATAGRLREAGFTSVESAAGDANDLFRLITARRLPGLHVMAVGERHGLALARQLRAVGITILRRKVYAARPLRALPAPAAAALGGREIAGALFYSAESARAFTALKPAHPEAIIAYALSPAVAAPLQNLPWRAIHVALAPTEADMMALLA